MLFYNTRYKTLFGVIVLSVLVGTWFTVVNPFAFHNAVSSVNSSHLVSSSQSSTSYHDSVPWIVPTSKLPNSIIHYSMISSSYQKDGHGLEDGRKVRGDMWEQTDDNGHVVVFHGIYTSVDGSAFYQEVYENTSIRVILYGKKMLEPRSADLMLQKCVTQALNTPTDIDDAHHILFTNETALKDSNFNMYLGTFTQVIPVAFTFPQMPHKIYHSSGPVHVWTKKTPLGEGHGTQVQQIEVGEKERLLLSSETITDASKMIVSKVSASFGEVDIYNVGDISSSVFSTSQSLVSQGGCIR